MVAERLKRSVSGESYSDAQTDVDGQLVGELPVVLHVEAEVLVLLGEAAAAGGAAVGDAEQQRRQFAAHGRRRRIVERSSAPQAS